MTELYNLKSAGGGAYLIAKFDRNLEVESTYILSADECACPQAHKPTCRHRRMLPLFLKAEHVDDGWFLDFQTRQWVAPVALEPLPTNEEFEAEAEVTFTSIEPVPTTVEPAAPASPPPEAATPVVGTPTPTVYRRGVRV